MSKSKKPTPPSNESLLEYRAKRAAIIGNIVALIVRVGGVVLCTFFVKEAVVALAGKETLANIGLRGNFSVSTAVAWLFGASGAAYGLGQRRLRRDAIETQVNRIPELEAKLDPGRSSSRLTKRGETNPKDRP